jgi:predicted lipid-binding transport protein (Tim44 family)
MSHLGMGEAFGSFLLLALLAVAAFLVVRMLMRRKQQPQPAGMAYRARRPVAPRWRGRRRRQPRCRSAAAEPVAAAGTKRRAVPAAAAPAAAFVPAAFDSEGFARTTKMIFIRLQAANDAGDLDDLRAFTTPEMFAELSMDIQERSGAKAAHRGAGHRIRGGGRHRRRQRQVVSVRFRGQVREESGAAPVAVDEVWHLVKPADGSRSWAIAGIEQWKAAVTTVVPFRALELPLAPRPRPGVAELRCPGGWSPGRPSWTKPATRACSVCCA